MQASLRTYVLIRAYVKFSDVTYGTRDLKVKKDCGEK